MTTTTSLHRLTARQVLAAEDGDLNDGGGLFLRINAKGSSWVLRYTSPTGRRREIGIGAAHRSTLAQAGSTLTAAREQAQAARDLLRRKVDPMDDRERRRQEAAAADAAARQEAQRDYWTLARAARDYHARVIEPTRTSRHAAQWISSLENHVPAALWRARLVDITAPAHLSALLAVRPHERARRHEGDRVPETLRRIRQRLDSTFEDAVFHGRCATNPAAAIRRKMRETARVRQARGHFAALPYREAPDIVQRLRAMPGTAARSLEFAILTVARTSEVLLAEWPEFDLDAGTWTVPAGRMKAKKEHTVYLTLPAVEILKTQAGQADRYVFPSTMPRRRGKPQSNMAMLAVLGRLGVRDSTTVHGLCRSTFSTWANETGAARPDVIEACLAHEEVNRVRAAYNRAEFAADRRALLQSWADYLARPPAVVVALKAARGAA